MEKEKKVSVAIEINPENPCETACNFFKAVLKPVLDHVEKNVSRKFRGAFMFELSDLIEPPPEMRELIKATCEREFPQIVEYKYGKKAESETIH